MKVTYIRFDAPRTISLQTAEERDEPRPGEALVACDYSGVSVGTETANLLALPNTSGKFPWHPGYSSSGHVLRIGDGVTNVAPGDRVIVTWAGHRSHYFRPADRLVKVHDGVDQLDACFAHIASFPMLGVRKLGVELGESVMVIGLGILGLFACQVARLSGAIPVIVSDLSARRRELALELGCDHALSPADCDLAAAVRELTGGVGVRGIVEVTGKSVALQQALECVAEQGRISLLGCTRISDTPIDFYQYVHRRGVSLIGAHTFSRPKIESRPGAWTEKDDYETFFRLVATGRLKVRPLVSEVVSAERAPELYTRLIEESEPPPVVAFDWRELH
jgi:2-desacetyl-2-hydroxyethyl bacteriochlorophyllide A dehydrogenase